MMGTTLDIVRSGSLPEDGADFFQAVTDPDGLFTRQEGETWDFKESWPTSYSDPYFGNIARLICGFANTAGGLIVFGVSDKKRTGSANAVEPNLDKLELAFRQLTDRDLDYQYRRYAQNKSGIVDVLLVRQKPPQSLPYRFNKPVHQYKEGTIWVRHGSEVREAEGRDVPSLYCRSTIDIEDRGILTGQLPPSPATVRTFVGRMQTIDQIFAWLFENDEPRTFLWGKGGSGKSTIAYEVCKNIKYHGKGLVINDEDALEQVMFISAKKQYLNIGNLKSEDFTGTDFGDEHSLYVAILALGAPQEDDLYALSVKELKVRIQEFFDNSCCLVVIDDIDTLTTSGKEAGIDFLYRVLSRSKKPSKLLYTLRNRPTHSISNSIEVPGLPPGDYEDFIEICAKQFNVPPPSEQVRDGRLKSISESRPLVVESIIALRRNSGSYDGAFSLFDQASGEDVRRYVFDREWRSLNEADRGREVLALLAIYGRPIGMADLCTIAKLEQQRVAYALATIQEMFLVVDNDGEESIYDLGELTRSFVSEVSRTLDYYELIKARVEKFKSTFYPDSPDLNRLLARFQRASYELHLGNSLPMRDAFDELNSDRFPPRLTEDPRFLSLRANVALFQDPPALDRARRDFESAFAFRHSPDIEFVREWFDAERRSDMANSQTARILALVLGSKGYSQEIRLEFTSKRATFLYNFARENMAFEPDSSVNRLFEALDIHLANFKSRQQNASSTVVKSEEHARNTAFFLIQQLLKGNCTDRFLDFLYDGVKEQKGWFLDPLVEPISYLFQSNFRRFYRSRKDLQRLLGRIEQVERNVIRSKNWFDRTVAKELSFQLGETGKKMKKAIGDSYAANR